ncbi:MAG: hypothetical protein N4A63_14795 [Vallitalea sp.]|nr:hypothetical protein [Vallitalea sp.]
MTDIEKEKTMEDFFEKRQRKEKRKLIIRTAIITSIISVVVFCIVSYKLYSYNRYKECLYNDGALYLYQEGELRLIEDNDDTKEKIYLGGGFRIYMNEVEGIYTISDENDGFIKIYKDNILQHIYVDDYLADFVSYLNPKVWFGGARHIISNRTYNIRSDKEISKLKKLIDEGGENYLLSSDLHYIKIDNKYIITR